MKPVNLAFNREANRAAFRLFHPKGNIVTAEMIGALAQALETIAENPHLKLVTFEGAGADFSFGASIPEHAPGEIDRVLPEAHALIHSLLSLPVVTAALVAPFAWLDRHYSRLRRHGYLIVAVAEKPVAGSRRA